jgi:hypothetical protein
MDFQLFAIEEIRTRRFAELRDEVKHKNRAGWWRCTRSRIGVATSQLDYLFVPPKMLGDAYQAICMRISTITDLQIDIRAPRVQEHTDVWSGLPLQV